MVFLVCCCQRWRQRDGAGTLRFFLSSFLSAVQMHFGPEAIKSYFDKVQHQNKIMRQIRGFKNGGGVGTEDRERDADEKEEILFMLDVAMMLIFRCTIKLGWPHQSPQSWVSGRLVWFVNNNKKHAAVAITFIFRPRGTFNILICVHMRRICASIWPFSISVSYSASFSLSVLPLSEHFFPLCVKRRVCVCILCMVKWQMEVWEAGNLLLSLSVLLHRALITE